MRVPLTFHGYDTPSRESPFPVASYILQCSSVFPPLAVGVCRAAGSKRSRELGIHGRGACLTSLVRGRIRGRIICNAVLPVGLDKKKPRERPSAPFFSRVRPAPPLRKPARSFPPHRDCSLARPLHRCPPRSCSCWSLAEQSTSLRPPSIFTSNSSVPCRFRAIFRFSFGPIDY